MSVWPVLVREVREASRQPATYRMRWVAALAVVACSAALGLETAPLQPGRGSEVFEWLYRVVFVSCCLIVTVMSADCLSREHREGTLGLLFLAPLRAWDVVLAKLSVHSLRGVTLWLAALPVFTIPFLIGGVTWQQATAAVLYTFSALALGLSAGVLASALSKSWSRATASSLLILISLLVLWCYVIGAVVIGYVEMIQGGSPSHPWDLLTRHRPAVVGIQFVVAWKHSASVLLYELPLTRAAAANRLMFLAMIAAAMSLVLLTFSCAVAAFTTRRRWRLEPPSRLRVALERGLSKPLVGRDLLRRWLTRSLHRNPVGWLHLRSWSARIVMFAWLAVVIGVMSGLLGQLDFWMRSHRRYHLDLIYLLVAMPLLMSMAASAAGSFRRERETGMLELVLVTAITETRLVRGRLLGLYSQFFPSILMLAVGWTYLLSLNLFPWDASGWSRLGGFLMTAGAIPCIGLFFSLRQTSFLAAFLYTLLVALGLPWFLSVVWDMVLSLAGGSMLYPHRFVYEIRPFLQPLVACVLACVCLQLLTQRLRRREFEFTREVT